MYKCEWEYYCGRGTRFNRPSRDDLEDQLGTSHIMELNNVNTLCQRKGFYSQTNLPWSPSYIGPKWKRCWKEKSLLRRLPCQLDLTKYCFAVIMAFNVTVMLHTSCLARSQMPQKFTHGVHFLTLCMLACVHAARSSIFMPPDC